MAHQLGVGMVDNADEPLQPRLQEAPLERFVSSKVEQKARNVCVMAETLVTIAMGRSHALNFHLAAPIGSRRHSAGVRAKANQCRLTAKSLSAKLANIQLFTDDAHFGVTSVADVGIMCPDH